ncbi:MAG: hypothetical protein ACP5Q5_11090 [Brevinematia bacterium]
MENLIEDIANFLIEKIWQIKLFWYRHKKASKKILKEIRSYYDQVDK